MKYCEHCDNRLRPNFNNDELTFKCQSCHLNYKSDPEDTLRRERTKESNIMIYEKILNKAVADPATIKASLNCKDSKCKGDIVKQVRIGNDMRLYNICITCNFQWLST